MPFGKISRHEMYGGEEAVAWFYFNGKPLDDETGLYYYGARYYDPALGRFISADTKVVHPNDPQDLNRYSYCRNNPVNLVDPTGHSWFKKFFGKIIGAIAGIATTIFTGGNFMLGMQVFNMVDSTYTAAMTGNWGGFAGSIAGAMIGGAIGVGWAKDIAGMLGEKAFTFGGGFLIGATEFGMAGFGAGLGGALGSGAKIGDAFKAGAMGLGIGAITGGIIEGTYLSGKQNFIHGLNRQEVGKAAGVKRQISLSVVKEPLPGNASDHWGLKIEDNYNEFNGTWDFRYEHSFQNDAKVLLGDRVRGIASPVYDKVFSGKPQFQSNQLNYITKVYRNIQGNVGYHYYKLDEYNCQTWVNNRLGLQNDGFSFDQDGW